MNSAEQEESNDMTLTAPVIQFLLLQNTPGKIEI